MKRQPATTIGTCTNTGSVLSILRFKKVYITDNLDNGYSDNVKLANVNELYLELPVRIL